jgi:hypothetical protein
MPLVQTRGAASAQGFGEFAQAATAVNYIEDVFSTFLYTGTGATQTITNGIDLSGKGGLTWIKSRSAATDHALYDTARGATFDLVSNSTAAQTTRATGLTSFNSTGFSIGTLSKINTSAATYTSWSFREQAKFFDVVTYTGTGANRTIAHNLGSVPGWIIVKRTDTTADWAVYHRSLANTQYLLLNTTAAAATGATYWNSTTPTSSVFSVGTNASVNASGGTYVAYVFAHDAGSFGLTGTDNVISCGSYTGNGSATGPTVTLGYEPQWLLIKRTNLSAAWSLADNMRGLPVGGDPAILNPYNSDAETTSATAFSPNATGFQLTSTSSNFNASGSTYIYIAIRRGPMKVPTVGTSVYQAVTRTGNSPTVNSITSVGFPPDAVWQKRVSGSTASSNLFDRLRGRRFLASANTGAETAADTSATRDLVSFDMAGFTVGEQFSSELNANTRPEVYWNFGRAPSVFDVVCYTGTGSVLSLTHNLTVAPEFILIKSRSDSSYWIIGANFGASTYALKDDWGYNASNASRAYSSTVGFNAQPTSTTVSLSTNSALNVSASTYVMYMWATCAGVSKVGTYTGTGALQTINCGFTSGARFVLITRIGVVGDVNTYIYDSARGISSGNDPYLLLEATSVEVTGTNYVDTTSTGFQVTAAAPAGLNASGGSYIFLAIA